MDGSRHAPNDLWYSFSVGNNETSQAEDSDVQGAANEAAKAASAEPKRRSPAEAFDELKAAINRSSQDISDLWDFSQKVKDKLLGAADTHRLEGMLPVLDSMLQIHQILFVRVRSTAPVESKKKADKTQQSAPEQFVATLLETVEDELKRHGAEVVNPEPGAAFDVQIMECTQKVKPESRKQKANTIAAVNRCGFLYKPPAGGATRLLTKAQVEVFAK